MLCIPVFVFQPRLRPYFLRTCGNLVVQKGRAALKTVIYLDELLVINFLIAVFLLSGAAVLCGAVCVPRRIAAGSALAAVFSLLLLAPQLPFAVQLFSKLVGAALCVAVAFERQRLRPFIRLCAWYLLLNLTLAGVVSGLILSGGSSGLETNNLVVYLNISPLLLLLCVVAVYLILRLLLWCFERPRPGAADLLCVQLAQCIVQAQAFCDTGFSLQQPASGRVGVMLSLPSVQNQLPKELELFLTEFFRPNASGLAEPPAAWRLRFVACTTAAGRGLFPAVPAEQVVVRRGGREYKGKALVIFCQQSFPYGCGAAYSAELLEQTAASS